MKFITVLFEHIKIQSLERQSDLLASAMDKATKLGKVFYARRMFGTVLSIDSGVLSEINSYFRSYLSVDPIVRLSELLENAWILWSSVNQ